MDCNGARFNERQDLGTIQSDELAFTMKAYTAQQCLQTPSCFDRDVARCVMHEQSPVKLDAQNRKVSDFHARAMDHVEACLRKIEHDLIGTPHVCNSLWHYLA